MKNNSFFRCHRLFLIPFFFLFFGNRVHPQSVIYTSNQYSEYSIIRNYKKNVDITYSLIGDIAMNSRGFNYVDRYSTTIVSAEIPLNYAINDFVVNQKLPDNFFTFKPALYPDVMVIDMR